MAWGCSRDVLPRRRAIAIQNRLLCWYASNRRLLPWRRHPDPYRVWVAEIMLQQTQVAAVLPYYERFMARFPDLASLAKAREDDVVSAWAGLGYYARARNLHRAAGRVVQRHAGGLPRSRSELEALPGIGRYTAGAILSIAFGLEEPIVDGNVRRVLSRLLWQADHRRSCTAERRSSATRTARKKLGERDPVFAEPLPARLEAQARALVRGAPPSELNQALMELGALVCRPLAPLCGSCPLARLCSARRSGVQERVPPPRRRPPTRRETRAVAFIQHGGSVLLERAEGPGVPRGMWDLPGMLVPGGARAPRLLERHLHGRGLPACIGKSLASVEHSITFRRIHSTAYEATLDASRCSEEASGGGAVRRWVDTGAVFSLPLGAAARRLLAKCLSGS